MKTHSVDEFTVLDGLRSTLCVRGMEDYYEDFPEVTKAEELDLNNNDIGSVEAMLGTANEHSEVREQIDGYVERERTRLNRKLARSGRRSAAGKRALANRAKWSAELARLPDYGDDIEPWLRSLAPEEFVDLKRHLADWLHEEPEPPLDGVREAYRFFQRLPAEQLDILGVSLVDGEHPGSDYFAAELDNGVEEANAAAESLGLPIKFFQ